MCFQAATGIAKLITRYMVEVEGVTLEQAGSCIWMMDIDGLLTHVRKRDVICGMLRFFLLNMGLDAMSMVFASLDFYSIFENIKTYYFAKRVVITNNFNHF